MLDPGMQGRKTLALLPKVKQNKNPSNIPLQSRDQQQQ